MLRNRLRELTLRADVKPIFDSLNIGSFVLLYLFQVDLERPPPIFYEYFSL